jgi:hypothetical protein
MAVEVYLEDIELPDLAYDNEFAQLFVDSKIEQTLDRRNLVWEQTVAKGRTFDLVGGVDTGHIERSVLDQLHTCAGRADAVYLLHYHGEPIWVRFRHEDPPVISAIPAVPRINHEDDDYYHSVRLKFMEV